MKNTPNRKIKIMRKHKYDIGRCGYILKYITLISGGSMILEGRRVSIEAPRAMGYGEGVSPTHWRWGVEIGLCHLSRDFLYLYLEIALFNAF